MFSVYLLKLHRYIQKDLIYFFYIIFVAKMIMKTQF